MSAPLPHEDPLKDRAERIGLLRYDYQSQPKELVSSCNLCGGDRWTVCVRRDRYGYPAEATSCWRCGLTVLNPRMTAQGYQRFYDGVYRPLVSAFHGRRIDARTIQAEQRVYAADMAAFAAPLVGRLAGRPMLDIGGSTGVVASHFARTFNLRASVIDPAPDELAEAEAAGVETIRGLVEQWDPGGRRFALVGMFQTIDHLLDVASTLAKVRTLIDDDGVFLVDVVDFRAAYLRAWSVEAAVKIDHPYSLVQETAEAYLSRAGFEPLRKSYSADHLHVAYLCRPCPPQPETLPSAEWVRSFFTEVRYVQNSPRPTPPGR
jgi:SAM-dependent methyltransferase